jgi:hypothetical protein
MSRWRPPHLATGNEQAGSTQYHVKEQQCAVRYTRHRPDGRAAQRL